MQSFCDEIRKLGRGIENAARYRMLEALMRGPRSVSQLIRVAKLSQPAVSQHLKTLKACSLVADEKRGIEVFYSLNTEYLLQMLARFAENIKKCRRRR
ncbi:helix-turn-helix transcriptional regulator [Candidatus Parcubacteria bacterium]|nr:helix-turn-helix transcriptional regulator [Candidatus Parcubacteria bacterium]